MSIKIIKFDVYFDSLFLISKSVVFYTFIRKMKKTKIIATVSHLYDEKKLLWIANAGVNIIRLNFSHASYEDATIMINMIRKLNAQWKTNLSILLDTKWPEIRSGDVKEKIIIKKGDLIKLFIKKNLVKWNKDIFCDYPQLINDVKKWQMVIIDSWLLKTEVVSKTKDYVTVRALSDHLVWSRRHINLPWVKLSLPGLTAKDKADILYGIEKGVDFIAASFIRNKANVSEIRTFLKKYKAEHINIISKIENQEALENLEEIVKASDAIMIARWDLWVELPIQKLPFFQKEIMDMCFSYGKTVIIATELLKSMVSSPFPTRAEVSDVYNSVMLRTDCLMLSEETAIGNYPIESVQTMTDIIEEAEKHTNNKHKDFAMDETNAVTKAKKMLAKHAFVMADEYKAKCIVLFTHSGKLANIAQNYKPNVPVFVFCTDDKQLHIMNILFGITPVKLPKRGKMHEEDKERALLFLKKKWIVKKWDKVVVIWDTRLSGQIEPHVKIMHW